MKIVVCGARNPKEKSAMALARELGVLLAKNGFEVVTGATVGVSFETVCGAKEAGGKAFGVSPAKDKQEHIEKFGYPVVNFDEIEFTGAGVPARNLLLVQKSDVVLFIGGGVGTLNELTIALQLQKIIGVLESSGGVAANAKQILSIIGMKNYNKIVFAKKPALLVKKILNKIKVAQNTS